MGFFSTILNILSPRSGTKEKPKPQSKTFEEKYNDRGIFSYTESGFIIELKSGPDTVDWNEIEKLVAYKVDMMTSDEICMEITLTDKIIRITEETPGWHQFVLKTKEVFAEIPKSWDHDIASPAFATNFTTLFERDMGESSNTHFNSP